jgi:hypothetical protein
VAAMVKEQDVTDAFFDWLEVKSERARCDASGRRRLLQRSTTPSTDMFEYIQARWKAGTANISILEPLPELPIMQSFSVERAVALPRLWEVAYHKCCEVVGTKAIVDIIIDDLVNWGKLRQAKKSEYDRAEWIIVYDWCKKEANTPRDPKSLNQWSYNSAVFIERCREAGCDALTRRLLQQM